MANREAFSNSYYLHMAEISSGSELNEANYLSSMIIEKSG
jgi:hypothetical protein